MMSWDTIKSKKEADLLFSKGELIRDFLLPSTFGGQDRVENIIYLPSIASQEKSNSTIELSKIFQDGLADHISVIPEYSGDSFIPSKIIISAWRGHESPIYCKTINVW